MDGFYTPYEDRVADSQYRDRLQFILENGELVQDNPQGVPALTCFGTLPQMVFDLSNGAPIITDRSIMNFWRKPVAEIFAFAQGIRTVDGLIAAGCDFWKDYSGKGEKYGLAPNDLGPGSYGAAFHDFPMPDGGTYNQYGAIIRQIQERPELRTHFITPWIPFYTERGKNRKVVVAPCHGWQQFRVINGRLDLVMTQRSADFPIGVPANMVQYAAILIAVARVTRLRPGRFIHQFGDAHIYESQIDNVRELVRREPKRLPTLTLTSQAKDFFQFTKDDFTLTDYDPHPAMPRIPYHA
jgi:thymidylate synthase